MEELNENHGEKAHTSNSCTTKEELRDKYKVKELGIFGSYARGEEKIASDIDNNGA